MVQEAGRNRLIEWIGSILAAAGFVLIGFHVVRLWWDPTAWGDPRWIGYMADVLKFEFAVLCVTLIAAGLASATRRLVYRVMIAAGLLGLCLGPAILVHRSLGADPLSDYLLVLVAGRFLAVAGMSSSGSEHLLGHTAVSGTVLLLVILGMLLVTALIPMPMGGIDEALLERISVSDAELPWDREPQRAMATIVVYCAIMAWVELVELSPWKSGLKPSPARGG